MFREYDFCFIDENNTTNTTLHHSLPFPKPQQSSRVESGSNSENADAAGDTLKDGRNNVDATKKKPRRRGHQSKFSEDILEDLDTYAQAYKLKIRGYNGRDVDDPDHAEWVDARFSELQSKHKDWFDEHREPEGGQKLWHGVRNFFHWLLTHSHSNDLQIFKQFFHNKYATLKKAYKPAECEGQEAILQFRAPSTTNAFHVFKCAHSENRQASGSLDEHATPEPVDVDRGSAKHNKMVNISKDAIDAWRQLSDEEKLSWKEQAAKINDENNMHEPKDCFE